MISLIKKVISAVTAKDIIIEVVASEKEEFGHYSTNVAFKLAPILKKSPMGVAEDLVAALRVKSLNIFEKIDIAAPGFINFWLAPEVLQEELKNILVKKQKREKKNKSLKINVEFVSANPTGPLTMANGRGGFYGDVLANILEATGNKVTREYYVNDAGNQVRILGESILAELEKKPKAENYYQGAYIKKLAKMFTFRQAQGEGGAEKIGKKAADILLKEIKKSLKAASIKHDVWFSENKNLHKKKELQKPL
ncbi:MAG: arginyl-tRNA synthetase, partial [Parcubacteria group bacterium Athens1014_26]